MLRVIVLIFLGYGVLAQSDDNRKWFSLGMRSTASVFSDDGLGIGTGGQFRVQFNKRVNSDWFADYITININDKVKSEYAHIGWSVLYYPFKDMLCPQLVQPYILAGHCFDYNKKTSITSPNVYKDRWGSAVQTGAGTHINLTEKFDISLMAQYMIHLTSDILFKENNNGQPEFYGGSPSALEGHLLITISVNYKIFSYGK
ncbi:MAG: hypothetical protein KatS3mg028_0515 [Bacteroidia bacterium]|nr:MAG: hypothetical protein KatS3mg028_0515 [Bacteroidia bacterium]